MQVELFISFGKVVLGDLLADRITCEAYDAIAYDFCQEWALD